METKFESKPYWHIHHETLLEWNTEPIENRIAYIKVSKSPEEIPTRLRLLKPVQGLLPEPLLKARADLDKAWADIDKAWADYYKAWADYNKAIQDNLPAIEALHAQECPNCPWNGKTIFP